MRIRACGGLLNGDWYAAYEATAVGFLHNASLQKLSGAFGALPVVASDRGAGQRPYESGYTGTDGLQSTPAHVTFVSIAMGCSDVEALQRGNSHHLLKFNPDLEDKKIKSMLVKKAYLDSVEGILALSSARMDFCLVQGQEHPKSREAIVRWHAAVRDCAGDLSTDLVEVAREEQRSVYWTLLCEMNKLEQMRFKRRLTWDAADGQLIPSRFIASSVQAVKYVV